MFVTSINDILRPFFKDVLWPWLFISLLFSFIINFIISHLAFSYLQKKYPLTYAEFGIRPMLKFDNRVASKFIISSFITQKKYKKLNDTKLNVLCTAIFFLDIIAILMFAVFFFLWAVIGIMRAYFL